MSRSRFRSSRAATAPSLRADAPAALRDALAESRSTRAVWRGSPAAKVLKGTSIRRRRRHDVGEMAEGAARSVAGRRPDRPGRRLSDGTAAAARRQGRRLLRRARARARRDERLAARGSRRARSPVHARAARARAGARRRRLPPAGRSRAQPALRVRADSASSTRSGSASSTRRRARSSCGTRPASDLHAARNGGARQDDREQDRSQISMRALVVDDELGTATAEGRAVRALVQELQKRAIEVVEATSAEDGMSVITSDSAIHAVLIDWTLGDDEDHERRPRLPPVRALAQRQDPDLPDGRARRGVRDPVEVMEMVDEFVWTLEDTAAFVGGRVAAAIRRYVEVMLPPLAAALMKFTQEYEYSWHTPGHQGGTAFLKSPVGRIFFDYFGENMLRSDLSISVGSLGSLLDHTGPIGEHEKYAARVFGAHRTYCVTNGTSMSNRVIFMAAVARDQIALCDRNCHKSIEHSLVMTGGIPNYLVPLRNRYGIIGPIPPDAPGQGGDQGRRSRPIRWSSKGIDTRAVYSVITNSTYDGLCYNARRVEELLDPSVDRIHFDEAWYAYARFNPLYRDRHAMHGDPKDHKGPTIFATHSTHKLLAALSQASFLHIRDGRSAIPHSRFNESYMMQASTSPLYPIIVSNDITAAMMDGPGGRRSPTSRSRKRCRSARRWAACTGSSRRRASGSSGPGTPTASRPQVRQEGAVRGCTARNCSRPIRSAGCCIRARPGTASAISKTTTACSTRSRCRSSRRASPTRAASTSAAFRRASSPRTCSIAASRSRRRPTSRSWSCSRSASPRASGARSSTRCSTSSATTTATRRWRRSLPQLAADYPDVYGSLGLARPRRPDVRAAARLAADALARRGVLDAAEAGHDAERGVSAPGARRDRARAARQAGRPRARHQRRAVPAGHSDAHAGRVDGREGRPVSRLPAGAGGLGQALPRLRARHARRREPRRRPLRAVPEGGRRRAHERSPAARCR